MIGQQRIEDRRKIGLRGKGIGELTSNFYLLKTINKEIVMDFPDLITNLPKADIPFTGVRGWILQSEDKQIVFMDIAPIGKVDEHSHSAQFGVMLDGEMSLTIGGETKRYKKGDTYFIPDKVPHSAVFHSQVKVMDMFNEKERYKIKREEV